jgi:hypothetical protein
MVIVEGSADLGAAGVDGAGEEFCARAAGATAKNQTNDESAIPIVVFMRQSQNSIIVHRPKAVKAIPRAGSSR